MSFNTVPFNPYPPSSEQQGSGGGGGSYVLPIAAADTLGGIKVGDNLTVEEDGTLNAADPYTLPIAEDNTLGGVKVGSGLSINDETGVLSADRQIVDYSTTEQATGKKWIDGSDIFRKVISFGELPNTTTKSVDSGLTNVKILKIYGVAISSSVTIPLPYSNEATLYFANGDVCVATSSDFTTYADSYVVLEYIKINE